MIYCIQSVLLGACKYLSPAIFGYPLAALASSNYRAIGVFVPVWRVSVKVCHAITPRLPATIYAEYKKREAI
ncbi:hypothetical protein Pcar_3167 [Syntrophotalea carbinolica DSM 2380]|uniref:Uncharacterized protein n=1 Tax=Syntrophotalea carbinolica (strain DSM 2380 / NBRC 103641 / GraBd1) TaxID=338963 RepID=Q0C700_SYNC1|nr:hypothetical protein Pcar_3167 [Syntrophotalea carbinolica DSM 2380]